MPNLVPKAALKGTGYALMERFALPSERKALQQLGTIHNTYNTPFSTKALTERLGQGAESADDLLGNALNSRLTESAASLEQHSPEIQGLVEKIYQRIRHLGEKRASKIPQAIQTLQEMATTPERQALLQEAMPYLERELSRPGIKRAWLAGSYGTKKPNPSDIDIAVSPTPAYREDFYRRIKETIFQDGQRRLAQERGDLVAEAAASRKVRELGTKFGFSRDEKIPVDIVRLARNDDPMALTLKEMKKEGRVRHGEDYNFTRLLQATLAAVGVGAASLLAPDEAEAAPRIRLNASQLAKLKEEAWPVAKELLQPRGAVEFDISRRWWSKRLGGGGMFWDRRNDEEKFLTWVKPYLEKGREINPRIVANAENFIEIGKREGRPYFFELALQHLHRILTHETPAANTVASLIHEYGPDAATQALLSEAKSPAAKEALASTLDYWKMLVALSTAGLAGLGLADPKEAEAGISPKNMATLLARGVKLPAAAEGAVGTQDILAAVARRFEKALRVQMKNPGIVAKRGKMYKSTVAEKAVNLTTFPKEEIFEYVEGMNPKDPIPRIIDHYKEWADILDTHVSEEEIKAITRMSILQGSLQPKQMWSSEVASRVLKWAGVVGAGAAIVGGDPKEAEAGKIPKLPTLINANKVLREAQAKGGLKGLLEKVEELVPAPDFAQGRVHGKVADVVKQAPPFLRKVKPLTETVEDKMGVVSSASRRLMGMELMGKTVKEVRKGNEPWRYVVFEDGTYLPIHKKYIASLSSSEGEKLYGTMFEMSEPTDQKLMLARSHALKMANRLPGKVLKEGLAERKGLLEELGEEAPSRVGAIFRGKRTELPTLYKRGIMRHGDQSPMAPERLAPPKVKKEAEVRLKDIVGRDIKAPASLARQRAKKATESWTEGLGITGDSEGRLVAPPEMVEELRKGGRLVDEHLNPIRPPGFAEFMATPRVPTILEAPSKGPIRPEVERLALLSETSKDPKVQAAALDRMTQLMESNPKQKKYVMHIWEVLEGGEPDVTFADGIRSAKGRIPSFDPSSTKDVVGTRGLRYMKYKPSRGGEVSEFSDKLKGQELFGKTVSKVVELGESPSSAPGAPQAMRWLDVVYTDGTFSTMDIKWLKKLEKESGGDLGHKVRVALEREASRLSRVGVPSGKVTDLFPRTKSNLERAIYNLERAKGTKGISKGDEYMLRRFKGMSPEEASEGLKLVSPSSIERMVLRILEEAKK